MLQPKSARKSIALTAKSVINKKYPSFIPGVIDNYITISNQTEDLTTDLLIKGFFLSGCQEFIPRVSWWCNWFT